MYDTLTHGDCSAREEGRESRSPAGIAVRVRVDRETIDTRSCAK